MEFISKITYPLDLFEMETSLQRQTNVQYEF